MNRILGYLLLCVGLFCIFFAAKGMYNTFIQGAPVAKIIQMEPVIAQVQQAQFQIPMDGVNQLANTALFAVLMLFIVTVGAKVASLGVNLVKAERIYDALNELDLTKKEDLETLKKA